MIHLIFAADTLGCNKDSFIFLPHWWEYLKPSKDALGQCSFDFNFPGDLLAIGLALIDILLRLAGFIAVLAIIAAGASHLFTGGSPEKAAAARKRILTAVLGLVIALFATALVTFIGRQISS